MYACPASEAQGASCPVGQYHAQGSQRGWEFWITTTATTTAPSTYCAFSGTAVPCFIPLVPSLALSCLHPWRLQLPLQKQLEAGPTRHDISVKSCALDLDKLPTVSMLEQPNRALGLWTLKTSRDKEQAQIQLHCSCNATWFAVGIHSSNYHI